MYLVMIISPTEKTSEVQDWGTYIPLMLKVRDFREQLLAFWVCAYARCQKHLSLPGLQNTVVPTMDGPYTYLVIFQVGLLTCLLASRDALLLTLTYTLF